MVRAAGERAAAVDKGQGPVGPSLADLAIGSPVPFPPVQALQASDVRAGYLGLYIAPVNKQPAPAYLLNRTVNVKGVPRHSTERWYWSVTLNACTAAQTTTPTQMHLPCRVTVSEDCGLVAGEGGFFCSPLCLPARVQTLVLGPSRGVGGGGVAGPRWLHCF